MNREDKIINYLALFRNKLIKFGRHNMTPSEKEADQGRDKFERFHDFVNKKYGEYAFEKMFLDEKMTEEKKLETLENWKDEFESQNVQGDKDKGDKDRKNK